MGKEVDEGSRESGRWMDDGVARWHDLRIKKIDLGFKCFTLVVGLATAIIGFRSLMLTQRNHIEAVNREAEAVRTAEKQRIQFEQKTINARAASDRSRVLGEVSAALVHLSSLEWNSPEWQKAKLKFNDLFYGEPIVRDSDEVFKLLLRAQSFLQLENVPATSKTEDLKVYDGKRLPNGTVVTKIAAIEYRNRLISGRDPITKKVVMPASRSLITFTFRRMAELTRESAHKEWLVATGLREGPPIQIPKSP